METTSRGGGVILPTSLFLRSFNDPNALMCFSGGCSTTSLISCYSTFQVIMCLNDISVAVRDSAEAISGKIQHLELSVIERTVFVL